MKPTLNPYLTFDGKTAEAMKFYQSVLGGELTMQTFGMLTDQFGIHWMVNISSGLLFF